jgi:hypothetical protein
MRPAFRPTFCACDLCRLAAPAGGHIGSSGASDVVARCGVAHYGERPRPALRGDAPRRYVRAFGDTLSRAECSERLFLRAAGSASEPQLEKVRDPAVLAAELEIVRADHNGRRLHADIGYVTPDDHHAGRGQAIRQARRDGLARARAARLAYHRNPNHRNPP